MGRRTDLRVELKCLIDGNIKDIYKFDNILDEIQEISENKGKFISINKIKDFVDSTDNLL